MYSDFTYSLTSGAVDIPVTPVIDDLVFTGEEDEALGAYVRRIETQMLFTGADYDTMYDNWESPGLCDDLPFNVKYQGTTSYQGLLRMGSANVQWDISNCRARASIDPSGAWYCAKENWEAEIDVLNNKKVTVEPFLGVLETLDCTDTDSVYSLRFISSCLTAPTGAWTVNRNQCELIISTYHYTTTYVREKATIACVSGVAVAPPGDGWTLLTDNCPTNSVWVRAPQTIIDNAASTIVEGESYDIYYDVVGGTYTEIDNGVLLSDVLKNNLSCTGVTVKSDFFGINEDGTYPSGTVYTEALSNLQSVIIWQKSDVKRPDATENATQGAWTYAKLLSSLREQFNVRWRLSGSTFRIEHVSYFTSTNGLDLTAGAYAGRITGFHAYSVDQNEVGKTERWFFMEDTTVPFSGTPIYYSNCVPYDAPEEIPHDMGQVNNDIGYIQASPDRVSDEGFVFGACYENTVSGTYHMVTENSATGFGAIINGHLSIPNLLDVYHRHERPLPSGTLNGSAVTFESTQRKRRQVDLSILMSNSAFLSWDESQLMKTQMGWGKVVRYRYSCKSCLLTLTLSHE